MNKISDSGVTMQDAGDGVVVGAAEEMKMIEQRVEVVEVATLGVTGVRGAGFAVCLVEIAGEAAEELGHGEVDFAVADAYSRIDEDGSTVRAGHDVAAPEVAVEQRRESGFDEAVFQMGEKLLTKVLFV